MRENKAALAWRVALASFVMLAGAARFARGETATQDAARDPMLIVSRDDLQVRARLEAGINLVGEKNLFWRLSDRFAASERFNPTRGWWEFYIKPGLTFEATMTPTMTLYGGLSAVASGTLRRDAFNSGDSGRMTLEEAYLGLRYQPVASPWSVDISAGPREYTLGTGMLIANGGSNGFERGALKLGPRKAWEMTAVARINYDKASAEFFYLDANERPDADSRNRLAGVSLRYDPRPNEFVGVSYGHVLSSQSPYVQAAPGGVGPPTILPGARDGLSFVYAYARFKPLRDQLPELWLGGDVAYEWNDRINMGAWGGRLEAGYAFADWPLRPTLSYSFQTLSGDNPHTSRLERFDPLFYDGGVRAWATGSKSAMLFINSNVQAHALTLGLTLTPRDLLSFKYSWIGANELGSPLQFGQATRIDTFAGRDFVVSGVTRRHLADDFFVEYTRIITPNAFLTLGGSLSKPGAGIRAAAFGSARVWSGAFANLVMRW